MADPVIQNNDIGSVILESSWFGEDTLTFTAAGTYLEGTILARDSSTLNLIAFVKGGTTNENGIPKTILPYDVTVTAAGNVNVRVPRSGAFRKERLIILADGDDSNVDAAVIDQLRDYGLVPKEVNELLQRDNST